LKKRCQEKSVLNIAHSVLNIAHSVLKIDFEHIAEKNP